ncbi:MAG: T9SS type A sorting domain-containing protein, partial [Bacteroidales bacterium]|nr:T9SS type A sorting domain-containing protein [Bacteroidales bacterium]
TNSVNLCWDANTEPDIAGYNIYKSDISGGPYTKINSELVADTTYIDATGTTNDFYCITAEILACTESRLSNEADFTTTINNYGYQQHFSISAYPNPFSQSTTISYTLPCETENAQILIFNIKGQKIKTLGNCKFMKGRYSVVWDGTNATGEPVGSGIYFCKLNINNKPITTKKIMLLK